jgi:hypothetical protein
MSPARACPPLPVLQRAPIPHADPVRAARAVGCMLAWVHLRMVPTNTAALGGSWQRLWLRALLSARGRERCCGGTSACKGLPFCGPADSQGSDHSPEPLVGLRVEARTTRPFMLWAHLALLQRRPALRQATPPRAAVPWAVPFLGVAGRSRGAAPLAFHRFPAHGAARGCCGRASPSQQPSQPGPQQALLRACCCISRQRAHEGSVEVSWSRR